MSWWHNDYARGRQIIIHDPRLQAPRYADVSGPENPDAPQLTRPVVTPPPCWRAFTVDPDKETVATIFSKVASACDGAKLPAGSRFDALHIMAHGLKGYVELGKDTLRKENLHVLVKIANRFRFVVFHSCLVGEVGSQEMLSARSTTYSGSQFARKVAQHTRARVILAREEQLYRAQRVVVPPGAPILLPTGLAFGILDFGDWEGPVDLYEENVPVRTFVNDRDHPFNLRTLIFGSISGTPSSR